jgi:DNA polymerase-3 subunit delta
VKVKVDQIGRAIDRPSPDIRLYLLHGPDEAMAAELAQRLGRAMGEGAERVDLDAAALKARPGALADEAASMSLFGDRRWIRVTGMGEESLEAVAALLAAPTAGNPVVALAPSVKGTGKLLKLADGSPAAMACALYAPDARQAASNTVALARDLGVRLMSDVAAAIVESAGGDRAVIAREVEKLALYLDAAPDRPQEADAAALAAIGANLAEPGMFDAIEAVVEGRAIDLGDPMFETDAGTAVPVLRQLAKRLMALADMRAEIDGGASAAEVVKRHRVFWKQEAATMKALRRWSSAQFATAIDRARRAERAMMASGNAGAVIADAEILSLARASARLG